MSAELPALLKRLETVTGRLEDLASKGGVKQQEQQSQPAAYGDAAAPSLEAFDEIVAGPLKQLVDLSAKIGGVVGEQVQLFEAAFDAQRQLLQVALKSKKPDAAALPELLKPTAELLTKIAELKEKYRTSPLFNHLATVAEGAPALGWVAVEPKPAPFIGEMKEAGQFYGNRILKDYKDKDATHVDFAKAFVQTLVDLQAFVKKFHTTGLVWNANGGDAKASAASAPRAAAVPPPSSAPAANVTASANAKPAGAGLFGELNKGGDITSGLKKVSKDQMTHKNPALRATSVVKAEDKAPAPGPAGNKSNANATRGPPKLALEGNKWFVENQDGNKDIVLSEVDMKQGAYIFGCNNSVITIKGKIGAVTIDSCKKTALVVDHVVSSIDIVNSKSIQAQILGKVPTALIDKTDGLNLFLSKECLGIEVFTAKSSELNVSIPPPKDGDDFIEKALPEQLKTIIVNGSIKTEIVEHKG